MNTHELEVLERASELLAKYAGHTTEGPMVAAQLQEMVENSDAPERVENYTRLTLHDLTEYINTIGALNIQADITLIEGETPERDIYGSSVSLIINGVDPMTDIQNEQEYTLWEDTDIDMGALAQRALRRLKKYELLLRAHSTMEEGAL